MKFIKLPPLITCHQCRHKHRALICHICKVPAPQFVVLKVTA